MSTIEHTTMSEFGKVSIVRRITEIMSDSEEDLSIRSLAQKGGLNREHLRLFFAGERPITSSMLEKIAQVLGVTAERIRQLDSFKKEQELARLLKANKRTKPMMIRAYELSTELVAIAKGDIETNNGKLDPFDIRYDYAYCLLGLYQLREAEEVFQQLLEHANSINGTPILAVRVLHQLGHVELRRKRYQIAEHYVSLALDKLQSAGKKDVHLQCSLLLTLGEIQRQHGHLRKAVVTLRSAVPIFEEREDIQGLGSLYMKLAQFSKGRWETVTKR